MPARHRAPAQEPANQAIGLDQAEVAPARLPRLDAGWPLGPDGPRRDVPEDLCDPIQGPLRPDVADDHQDRAVGPVVTSIEFGEVVDADPGCVLRPAQDRVAIGMPQIGDGQVVLVEPALGRAELTRPLLGDHATLEVDLAGSNRA